MSIDQIPQASRNSISSTSYMTVSRIKVYYFHHEQTSSLHVINDPMSVSHLNNLWMICELLPNPKLPESMLAFWHHFYTCRDWNHSHDYYDFQHALLNTPVTKLIVLVIRYWIQWYYFMHRWHRTLCFVVEESIWPSLNKICPMVGQSHLSIPRS